MTSMSLLLVCLALVTLTISTSADLNPSQFDSEVLQGNAVWVVKFYSAMCGSCQEFAPTWKSLSSKISNVVFGEVNIDEKEGMELANRLGALAEGIPNVQVFAKAGSDKGVSIFNGEGSATVSKLSNKIKKLSAGAVIGEDGVLHKK